MSVKVTCIYSVALCDCGWYDAPNRCEDWRLFEYDEPDCRFIEPVKTMHDGKEVTLLGSCKHLYFEDYMIHRTVTAFSYGDCVRIGKQYIPKDIIKYLSVDYGDGFATLIDERKNEQVKHE